MDRKYDIKHTQQLKTTRWTINERKNEHIKTSLHQNHIRNANNILSRPIFDVKAIESIHIDNYIKQAGVIHAALFLRETPL